MGHRFSRREFLAGAATLPLALRGIAQGVASSAPPAGHILVGTLNGEGIGRLTWNGATGELGPLELAVATESPTYLALHPRLPLVYAVNERARGEGFLASFALNRERGSLVQLNSLGTHGNGPTYLALDPSGTAAFAANYGGGTIACAPLTSEGDFLPLSSLLGNPQAHHGPVAARQDAAHMHCTVVSPDGRYVVACDLGNDALLLFRILPGEAVREGAPATPARLSQVSITLARPGAGPRHVKFHPSGRWLYCINELDCTIDLYDWDPLEGSLVQRPGGSVSTLASRDHLAGSTACELQVSPEGNLLYANTRGEDSIIVYRIHPQTGLLKPQQHLDAGGKATRYFTFDPTRRWLVGANQSSNTLSVFAHDPVTGRITPKPRLIAAPTPMFVLFV